MQVGLGLDAAARLTPEYSSRGGRPHESIPQGGICQRVRERTTILCAGQLERCQGCMALVEMQDVGLVAHRTQRANAADPEQ